MSETDIQNEIRLALSAHGVVLRMNTGVFKTEDGRTIRCGIKGTSDLLFIGNGYIAFIEVKTPLGRASPDQINFVKQIQKLGHKAGFARSVKEALNIILGGNTNV